MRSKRKLLISFLVIAFVGLAAISTIAIVFAFTTQRITTTVNISFEATDIEGSVSASYTIGGATEYLEPDADEDHKDGNSLLFFAEDENPVGNLNFPNEALELNSKNRYVIMQYTFTNNGERHYIASMSFDAYLDYVNMDVEYSINGVNYSEQRYAVVVQENTTRSYWIRIKISNLAEDASFNGDFVWLLEGCDDQTAEYLTMPALEFQEVASAGVGAYSVSLVDDGDYVPTVVFPSSINGTAVTTIAASTLDTVSKNKITSVYIPDSVTTIDKDAFKSFTNLSTVTFEQNESASGASAQSNGGLKTISTSAFMSCSSLTNFTIPNTVTKIGNTAFYGCIGLKSIVIPNNVTEIGREAFAYAKIENVIFGNSLNKIDEYAFQYCNFTEVILPDSVTTINMRAFRNNTNLTKIYLSENLTAINEGILANCTNLKSVNFPNSLTAINMSAFDGCNKITDVLIDFQLMSNNFYFYEFIDPLIQRSGELNLTIGKNVDIGLATYPFQNLKSVHVVDDHPTLKEENGFIIENNFVAKWVNVEENCDTLIIPDCIATLIDCYNTDKLKNIKTLHIGASFGIEYGGFDPAQFVSWFPNVTSITASEQNTYCSVAGNCLWTGGYLTKVLDINNYDLTANPNYPNQLMIFLDAFVGYEDVNIVIPAGDFENCEIYYINGNVDFASVTFEDPTGWDVDESILSDSAKTIEWLNANYGWGTGGITKCW